MRTTQKSRQNSSGRQRYTHFWATGPERLDVPLWNRIVRDCRKILMLYEDETTVYAPEKVKGEHFSFQDADEHMYGGFLLTREPQSFAYCRTNGLPYDAAVTGCLLVVKKHAPSWVKLTSDGLWEEWETARELLRTILSYEERDFSKAKIDFDELLDLEDRETVGTREGTR